MTEFAPALIHNGLAIYSTGTGEPLLLMPYPHGFGVAPIVQGPLADQPARIGARQSQQTAARNCRRYAIIAPTQGRSQRSAFL